MSKKFSEFMSNSLKRESKRQLLVSNSPIELSGNDLQETNDIVTSDGRIFFIFFFN